MPLILMLAVAGASGAAQGPVQTTPSAASPATYFEFGTVVALGRRTIDIQTFDERLQRKVQHIFVIATGSNIETPHVNDTVEVIFSSGAEWTIHRLVVLAAGIPRPGPPTEAGARTVPTLTTTRIAPPPPPPPRVASASGPSNGQPSANSQPVAGTNAQPSASSAPRNVAIGATAPGSGRSVPPPSSVALGSTTTSKPAPVVEVPLGAGDALLPRTPVTKAVLHEKPAEECNRSSADWPNEPLRLAVLDFRYPTEREESHDTGTTGGGSGTAVADLVFNRLDQLKGYAMSRGDRTRLYRADFAGAARVGRELGVDAVLAGTFQPEDPPPGSDPDFPPPRQYELRAGIVDTCTGQLLMRLSSIECPPGLDPNAAANGPSCKRLAVTAKQAADPKEQARVFEAPIDALLYPLEHSGPPPGTEGSAGVVRAVDNQVVSLRLAAGSALHPGDQVALHAWRLSKNPATYTLHNLHDEEIGRVTLTSVQGGQAVGTFAGDFPPHAGDIADLLPQ